MAARPQHQDLPDRSAVIDLQPLAAGDVEPARVEPQQVEQGGVDVGDVMGVLDRVEAQLVGRPMDGPALDPRSREPDGEGVRMMVAAGRDGGVAVADLQPGRPAELGAADDRDVVGQAPALQVPEQTRDGPVDPGARPGVQVLELRRANPTRRSR